MLGHLVWDWNGTLLDDFAITVAATNATFAACAGPQVSGEQHRRQFRRPISGYYAEMLGRRVDEAEFARLDKVFHDEYHARLIDCQLSADAAQVLATWAGTQSLLSMWFHDQLLPYVEGFGLTGHFRRIDGLRVTTGGGSKAQHLVRHLAELGVKGSDSVLIGDTLDDAAAAAEVGARCVLVTGGFTDMDRLLATGLPVAGSLTEAVRLAAG